MESSSYLLSVQPIGAKFDIKDGGQLITDSHLSAYNPTDLINITSLLVTFDNTGDTKNCTTVLPTLVK
jgi:hypothetical protein